jgi:hypothetical protein
MGMGIFFFLCIGKVLHNQTPCIDHESMSVVRITTTLQDVEHVQLAFDRAVERWAAENVVSAHQHLWRLHERNSQC